MSDYYRVDAGEELGILWIVTGRARKPAAWDGTGNRVDVPAGWRSMPQERGGLVPAWLPLRAQAARGGAAGKGKAKRRATSFDAGTAAEAGAKGGATTGDAKRRSQEHYRRMVEARRKVKA